MREAVLTRKGAVYIDEKTKQVFMLKKVDREYTGTRKSPIYYLQELRKGKAFYVSGVFGTKRENIFSFDIKDALGVKNYYYIVARNGGETLEIKQGNVCERVKKREEILTGTS